MGKYEYATGGKTGYTKLAKRTLVSTATKGDMDLIAVTLNAPDDWNDHINMYETAFKKYEMVKVISRGNIKGVNDSFYKGKIYFKNDVYYPAAEDEKDSFFIEYKLINSEKIKSRNGFPEIAGSAVIYLENKPVKEVPVFMDHSKLEKKKFFDRFKDIFNLIIGVNTNG